MSNRNNKDQSVQEGMGYRLIRLPLLKLVDWSVWSADEQKQRRMKEWKRWNNMKIGTMVKEAERCDKRESLKM